MRRVTDKYRWRLQSEVDWSGLFCRYRFRLSRQLGSSVFQAPESRECGPLKERPHLPAFYAQVLEWRLRKDLSRTNVSCSRFYSEPEEGGSMTL